LSPSVVEGGIATLGERVGLGCDSLSLSPRDQQVEQDRASAVLTDHDELAWPSLGELPGRCESDWSDHNRDGLASAGGLRQGVLSDEGEGNQVRVGDDGLHPHNFHGEWNYTINHQTTG